MNLTPKQEAFAQAYVETGIAAEAYRRAYPVAEEWKETTLWPEASKLLAHPKVSTRIEQLMQELQQRHKVTMDSLTSELDEALEVARTIKQPSAMVSAVMGKAKLHGLIVEKNEHAGKDGAPAIELVLTSRTKAPAERG